MAAKRKASAMLHKVNFIEREHKKDIIYYFIYAVIFLICYLMLHEMFYMDQFISFKLELFLIRVLYIYFIKQKLYLFDFFVFCVKFRIQYLYQMNYQKD